MKFRRKSDQSIEVTKLSSLIDRGVEIVGDVIITDGLRIDGHVRGDVRAKPEARGLLVLSEHGRIEGSVHAHDAVVNGVIDGDLEVDHFLELQPNAKVTGAIRYRRMRMECGATVNGSLERLPEQAAGSGVADNVVALQRAQGEG
jgi:cytoskeletal protein CcmA (bactofilin family)